MTKNEKVEIGLLPLRRGKSRANIAHNLRVLLDAGWPRAKALDTAIRAACNKCRVSENGFMHADD
jgi:hypothetical protein